MADPTPATPTPEPAQAQASPFNADALAGTIREQVKGAIGELQQQAQREQAEQAQRLAQQQQAARAQQDPVAQTIRPYIEPALQAMNLQVQAANDRADFYDTFPEARTYKQDVESMFQQLMAQGRPLEREAVWHYYKGKNAEAIAQRAEADKQAQLQASANQYATVGGPSATRPPGVNLDNFRSLPLDQQRDALKGVSF